MLLQSKAVSPWGWQPDEEVFSDKVKRRNNTVLGTAQSHCGYTGFPMRRPATASVAGEPQNEAEDGMTQHFSSMRDSAYGH